MIGAVSRHTAVNPAAILLWWFGRGLLLVTLIAAAPAAGAQGGGESLGSSCTTIEIYSRQGCPHCARAYEFLEQLKERHGQLVIISRDINAGEENRRRFVEINQAHGISRPGVPLFVLCGSVVLGFDSPATTGVEILRLLRLAEAEPGSDDNDEVTTGLFGGVSISRYGLPLFTLFVGLVDGFNPCAMWVLLMLLSLLLTLRETRRLALIAGTFVLVSGVVYFLFMAAWLNLFLIIGYSRMLQVILGLLAVLIGVVNIKDFLAFRQGVSLGIPGAAKPTLYARMRRVIYAENLTAAIFCVAMLAALVNLVELLCTAGLPALYTEILSRQHLSTAAYYGYLVLYNIAYVLDDALMVTVVVITMDRCKLQEQQGRWLKLVSGAVILLLGAMLVFAPGILF